MFPHQITVEQCHRPATHFEEFNQKHVSNRRFPRARKTGKEHSQSLFVPRRESTPKFARDFWKSEPGRNLTAVAQASPQLCAGEIEHARARGYFVLRKIF